jgi:hypothetical protein
LLHEVGEHIAHPDGELGSHLTPFAVV